MDMAQSLKAKTWLQENEDSLSNFRDPSSRAVPSQDTQKTDPDNKNLILY
jgi:hypothetical protein